MFTVSDFMQIIEGSFAGKRPIAEHLTISCFAIDLKEVKPGTVYFALSQPDYMRNCFNSDFGDSNTNIPSAIDNGAILVVTRRDAFEKHKGILATYAESIVFVPDVIRALQVLARSAVTVVRPTIIGVTGSAGKTTTKELISTIIAATGANVLATKGNQNNGIGVPLTLLRLASGNPAKVAVIEMGMSTPDNEIMRLCQMAPPNIAVVLNVLPVHLQYLKTIEAIKVAKRQIVENMASDGIAILNADDPIVRTFCSDAVNCTLFGKGEDADVRVSQVNHEPTVTTAQVATSAGPLLIRTKLQGAHNLYNILAAIGAAISLNISLKVIERVIADFSPPPQRGRVYQFARGSCVIDDSYNSNPVSLKHAVSAALGRSDGSSNVVLIIGDMLELGSDEMSIHFSTGVSLADNRLRLIIAVGSMASALAEGVQSMIPVTVARYKDVHAANEDLHRHLRRGDIVLLKGSRACKLEFLAKTAFHIFERNEKLSP